MKTYEFPELPEHIIKRLSGFSTFFSDDTIDVHDYQNHNIITYKYDDFVLLMCDTTVQGATRACLSAIASDILIVFCKKMSKLIKDNMDRLYQEDEKSGKNATKVINFIDECIFELEEWQETTEDKYPELRRKFKPYLAKIEQK